MSRFDEEQQPGPAVQQEPEPRLLTRPTPGARNGHGEPTHRQHAPESGLRRWSVRLRTQRKAPGGSPRQRRAWLLPVALGLVLLVFATALVVVLGLRHAITASLPQIDGSVTVAGLRAPVTVTRDSQGVPAITAKSLDDLLFAQGYVTASDRLWQMDGLRRHAAGELAEILGPGFVDHDRRQRLLQIRAAADRAAAHLPADQLAQLEAYSRGVNAFIDTHHGALPVEFKLLAYKPAPWSPRDTLLVSLAMFQDLSTEFPDKMNREALSAHLPAALLPDLYPVGSWRDQPPGSQSRDLTTPRLIEQIPLDPSQSRLGGPTPAQPEDLLAVSRALARDRCTGCRPGSNNWAVSGAHTESGAPLLSNDMHLSLAIPDIWYEASLHNSAADGAMDVVGFTLPGVPFVIVGRNAFVAWGVTNLWGDVQDLRVEHLRGQGENTEYQRADSSWAPVAHHIEAIRVRGGRDVTLDVLTTTHTVGASGSGSAEAPGFAMETPIISPLYRSEKRAVSLAWTAYDPANVTSPFLAVNTAADGASLVSALASFGGPSLNLVWADRGGHIGYHALGRIPVRGPAVQHPRAAPEAVEPGAAPADEGAEPEGEPQASLGREASPIGHFDLAAFYPARRTRAHARGPAGRPAATFRGRPRAIPHRAAPALPQPVDLPPAAPPINYTIGNAISPLPVDALDASQAWSGYVPYSALPAVVDPPGGVLATANARITPDDYPYAIANDWTDPFRVERIVHLLTGRRGLTSADMLRIQNDVHSEVDLALAQRLAYALDHASAAALGKDSTRLKTAANLLRDWDGSMAVDSPAAALISAVREVLWTDLLVPQIMAHDGTDAGPATAAAALYTWNERTTALELLLQHRPARWLPPGSRDWNDFLATVVLGALHTAHAPANLAGWRYGERHTVEIAHPLFGEHHVLSDLLGITGTTKRQPAPGDGSTIKAIGQQFGPSQRFTADLASVTAATGNITTGESANPHSPWYLDQFGPWLEGTSFDLPANGAPATHTLTLLPQ